MAIPRAREEVPPPLPPPRHIEHLRSGQDPGWQWGNTNSPRDTGFGGNRLATVRPGSSLYGGAAGSYPREPSVEYMFIGGREPSIPRSLDDMSSEHSNNSDEDRSIKSRPSLGNHRFTSERQLGHKTLQHSSNAYDKQLLSKIGGPNTPTRTTAPSLSSSSSQDPNAEAHAPINKLNGQLKPLTVPALSPGYNGFRSPIFDPAEPHRARYGSISTPGPLDESATPHRGSYDHSIFSEPDFGMEENGMRDLNINERSPAESDEYQLGPKGGLKRRASSPPSEAARDDRPTTSGHNDLYHRRSAQMLVNRNCTASRFQSNPSSLSSAGSASQRSASIGSSFGFSTAASSMTSYGGDQRLSPNALSPLGETDSGPVSPYAANRSLDPSPRGSLSRPVHQRGFSETEHPQIRKMSTDSMLHSRQNSIANRIPGAYICECCPKKPKKFDSEDELRLHELEKQYICQYCPNRFKNKNEAERHQNSLHLRRHSWSCATLAGVHAAFHPSPTRPAAADVCGYCGEEFPNPADWEARSEHLNHVHKFGECNQAKKFFRADHFRQHLKHSHAGTSGKWTNMLENACMRDEPPPQERVGSISSISGPSALAPKPGVINEVHDES
ncbi:hypothetical protein CFE70_007050 [Pyrenophora teres f. teres 0-1]|uniref:C2H2-type domain-containing protein n=2 Tax=Pyrenophora teres f. teres TaxID=97479 RepID=E3RFJ8_PYRTT|nr:hypothetical protein PTT_06499 [Pyrenophora teres f. teres 0-1]KAE8822266.1 hypothetical protein HRS9139_10287 [Pyrenophora teres f. teres]CAA9964291.1 hypothetical protein PTMSG1_07650 [Pyrenophora teres f. maculata]KAE8835053.1 hypothetical protein PTNB85_06386 [Pyrenophora teres f. teres]KAE8856741.1 hypothetical protein PTNB73_09463 [Pyrenophora teres f. teres]